MIRTTQQRAHQDVKGFKSPADDYLEGRLDIAQLLIVDPHCTFYFLMDGEAMTYSGILPGDTLVVDRSLNAVHDSIIVGFIEGNFYCRRYIIENGKPHLRGDADRIDFTGPEPLQVWGVVMGIYRNTLPDKLKKGKYRDVRFM